MAKKLRRSSVADLEYKRGDKLVVTQADLVASDPFVAASLQSTAGIVAGTTLAVGTNLDVSGTAQIDGTLHVDGKITADAALDVTGAVVATGKVTAAGLIISGAKGEFMGVLSAATIPTLVAKQWCIWIDTDDSSVKLCVHNGTETVVVALAAP